jgi:DNA polymerase elongation subunit (family B)
MIHKAIAIDIETVANEYVEEYVSKKSYSAAANLKDPEKIKANISEKRQADIDKAALHWWTGKIVCIGCVDISSTKPQKMVFFGADEKTNLLGFFSYLLSKGPEYSLTGKHTDLFDFPFIVGRALRHDIGIPEQLRTTVYVPRDVNHIFSRSSACAQIASLDDYAFGLRIDPKTAKGSDVAQMYRDGKWEELHNYCLHDAEIAAEMIRRYMKPFRLEEIGCN